MKTVEIVMIVADPEPTRAWGGVKAVDEPGMPTIAHIEVRKTFHHAFLARAGRHVFQFSVDRPAKVTLACVVDGAPTGPQVAIDCTTITAGQRYGFEVPS